MPIDKNEIFRSVRAHEADIIAIRRDIHAHPEIGFDVLRTAALVAAELHRLGLKVKTGVGQTGVIGDLSIPGATRRIALRADMDALPMTEQGNPPYRSTVADRAHMCGHDAHTAMLIGAARALCALKSQLRVKVRFIFQPNEEGRPSGAAAMIADSVLDGVDEIYGLHVWPSHPVGTFGLCPGPAMAQPDMFEVTIIGQGGHAAYPHRVIDPVLIGAQYITMLQSIVSRVINPLQPAVLSVTQFNAGTTHNVIPERAVLRGTVRTFQAEVQQQMRRRMEEMLQHLTAAYGATYEFWYEAGFPVTINHALPTENAHRIASALVGRENVVYPAEPSMGGEDFAYYVQVIPGCFMGLGIRNEAKGIVRMLHDPSFDLDEEAMIYGMAMHVALCLSAE